MLPRRPIYPQGVRLAVAFPNVPQNIWQRNQSFKIMDYFSNAVREKTSPARFYSKYRINLIYTDLVIILKCVVLY
jgi:hypothetical protein